MLPILNLLGNKPEAFNVTGMAGGSAALFLARAAEKLKKTVCCIVPSDEQMEIMARDISLFTDVPIITYPSFEIPPYATLSPDPATSGIRLATLYRLKSNLEAVIVITSIEAVQRRVLPGQVLEDRAELIISGEEVDREDLLNSLCSLGYELTDMVRQNGDISVRGGIIDVFAPATGEFSSPFPLRLDFFGDTLESIRSFDLITQRSLNEVDEAILLPATNLLFPPKNKDDMWLKFLEQEIGRYGWSEDEKSHLLNQFRTGLKPAGGEFLLPLFYNHKYRLQTFFDYLPGNSLLVSVDPPACKQQTALLGERIFANYNEALELKTPVLPPDMLFITPAEQEKYFSRHCLISLCRLPDPDGRVKQVETACGDHGLIAQEIELQRQKRGLLAPLIDRLIKWLERKDTTLIACKSKRQMEHIEELFTNYNLTVEPVSCPIEPARLRPGVIYQAVHPLSRGFDLKSEKIHILSANELFGEKRLLNSARKQKKRHGKPVQIETLSTGDIVVHRDHGLGVFCGLTNMEFAGRHTDFMEIEYQGGDKLFVPVDRLHWVSRYQGLSDQQPRLDKLGSNRWQTTRKKVTDAVWKTAHELLEIYARREMRKGYQFSLPGTIYQQLEESFPYEETPDQAGAIDDVIADMTSTQPMDRLVCGDVGYGKTEVAARGAFKAIEDGFQVAILVPTTVLAEQHATSFRDRFKGFAVEVACLNRFRSHGEQRKIIAGLGDGSIDLVIGTHALLSKKISFAKLGLLVVDEEHRFGVTHKEKIKKLKSEVDVLSMTATPIPRTLQMSLLGIRDLSIISTPPQQRRAVKTFLARYESLVIREAVLKEMQRGGQVFLVHNRVKSLRRVAEELAELVPQARIGIGHGQMPASQIEEVMVKFINHEIDVLVCTTIIESGLDISNANTIIINRADQLGLADIYQLRGRVGRSSRQSFAYLLVPSLDKLSKSGQKRLRALMDASELGSGFKLAMNDLQIRGGGNLLGVSQSGHIAAVGYDLYLDLLQATVEDLKQRRDKGISLEIIDPEVNLKISAYIPDKYIPDTSQRYHFYRRLSAAGSKEPAILTDLVDEMEDRYGSLPEETRNLCRLIELKYPLRELGIIKLEQGPDSFIFTFVKQTPVRPEQIISFMERKNKRAKKEKRNTKKLVRITPDQRLIVPLLDEKESCFSMISDMLAELR